MGDGAYFHLLQLTEDALGDQQQPANGQQEASNDSNISNEDSTFLQSLYSQTECWICAVGERFPEPAVLGRFRRNLRFLNRLLRQSRYPRIALIGRRGTGKVKLCAFRLTCNIIRVH
jgi:hypothetical protein